MPLILKSLSIDQSILQNLELLIIIHYNAAFLSLSVNFGLKMRVRQSLELASILQNAKQEKQ